MRNVSCFETRFFEALLSMAITPDLKNTGHWLTHGGALLRFLVIGRRAVWPPCHAHAGTAPPPTEAVRTRFSHKIFVGEYAIKPEMVAPTNIRPITRLQRVMSCEWPHKGLFTWPLKYTVEREFVRPGITGLLRQRISDCPSVNDLFREGSRKAAIDDSDRMECCKLLSSPFLLLAKFHDRDCWARFELTAIVMQ